MEVAGKCPSGDHLVCYSSKSLPRLLICLVSWIFAGVPVVVPAADLVLEFRHLWKGAPIEVSGKWLDRDSGESISFSRIDYLGIQPGLGGKWRAAIGS